MQWRLPVLFLQVSTISNWCDVRMWCLVGLGQEKQRVRDEERGGGRQRQRSKGNITSPTFA